MWWVGPSTHAATCSFASTPSKTGMQIGSLGVRKLMGQGKERKITGKLLLWAKQTLAGEFIYQPLT